MAEDKEQFKLDLEIAEMNIAKIMKRNQQRKQVLNQTKSTRPRKKTRKKKRTR